MMPKENYSSSTTLHYTFDEIICNVDVSGINDYEPVLERKTVYDLDYDFDCEYTLDDIVDFLFERLYVGRDAKDDKRNYKVGLKDALIYLIETRYAADLVSDFSDDDEFIEYLEKKNYHAAYEECASE